MKIEKFAIKKVKKYFKGNEEKTMWQDVGVITHFLKDDGSVNRIIEIPAINLEASIFPFEDKEKPANRVPVKPTMEMTPEEEYNSISPTKEVEDEAVNNEIPY